VKFTRSDIDSWERKAEKLEKWIKNDPKNWIKANNKRFPENKTLSKMLAFCEVDNAIEPLRGLENIIRQLRWGKPSIADILQNKYDEFLQKLMHFSTEPLKNAKIGAGINVRINVKWGCRNLKLLPHISHSSHG
jgi:hypothetical protein